MIKPAIKTSLLLFQSFLYTLVLFAIGGWYLSGLAMLLFAFLGSGGLVAVLAGVLVFFVIIIIVYWFRKATLKRSEYRFFSSRVEYYEGFLVKNRKTINYDRISNIGQRKGIIEGWFGLGTIFIDTAGYSAKGHELCMKYLEHPDQIYDWITKVTSRRQ